MKRRSTWKYLAVGLAAGLGVGWWLARHKREPAAMPHFNEWHRALAEAHGPVKGDSLAARIQAHYDVLWAQRPRFAQPALTWHLEKSILPGLALYRALLEEYPTQAEALAEAEQLFPLAYTGQAAIFSWFKRLPGAFTLLRALGRRTIAGQFPPEGWQISVVEDSADCFAFDIRERCFYRDRLTEFGAPELTPLFCKMDDLIYAVLPPEIVFTRTKTLGRGDDCCDFRYCRGTGR